MPDHSCGPFHETGKFVIFPFNRKVNSTISSRGVWGEYSPILTPKNTQKICSYSTRCMNFVYWTIECYCQWVIAESEFAWTWFPEVKVITLSHRLNVRMSCSVLILKRAEMHKSLLMRSCSFAQQEKMTWRKLFWVQQKHDEMKEIFWKVLFFLELKCYLFDQTVTSGNLLKAKVF